MERVYSKSNTATPCCGAAACVVWSGGRSDGFGEFRLGGLHLFQPTNVRVFLLQCFQPSIGIVFEYPFQQAGEKEFVGQCFTQLALLARRPMLTDMALPGLCPSHEILHDFRQLGEVHFLGKASKILFFHDIGQRVQRKDGLNGTNACIDCAGHLLALLVAEVRRQVVEFVAGLGQQLLATGGVPTREIGRLNIGGGVSVR